MIGATVRVVEIEGMLMSSTYRLVGNAFFGLRRRQSGDEIPPNAGFSSDCMHPDLVGN